MGLENKNRVFFFPNGTTTVCKDGVLTEDLHEPWLLLFVKFLASKGIDPEAYEYELPAGTATLFKTSSGDYGWNVNPRAA
jgi:hypothetical protein